MTKQEMLDTINGLKAEAIALAQAGKLAEAKAKKAELDGAQEAFDLLDELEAKTVPETAKPAAAPEKTELSKFCDSLRRGFRNAYTGMKEGGDVDGGYTVPKDIETAISKYKESVDKLEDLVTVAKVKAPTGARTYQTRAQHTGFMTAEETEKIGQKGGPKFTRVEYATKKRAGILPVSNELLADSDENIRAVVAEWFALEDVATVNRLVLEQVALKAKTDLKNLDGVKGAVNVTLGAAFKGSTVILTNDDGLNYLDTLKDGNGRYILSPDVQNPAERWLAVGTTRIPLKVVSNETLKTDTKKVPFIIGDLKAAITVFEYAGHTLTSSDVASVGDLNAFENDLTLFKGSSREDCKTIDEKAFVNGYITIT